MSYLPTLFKYVDEHQDEYVEVTFLRFVFYVQNLENVYNLS